MVLQSWTHVAYGSCIVLYGFTILVPCMLDVNVHVNNGGCGLEPAGVYLTLWPPAFYLPIHPLRLHIPSKPNCL